MRVAVVANAPMREPVSPLIDVIVRPGFGTADDYIAEQAGPGDIVVTADIPLAARCLEKDARVLDPKGNQFMDNHIGSALAMRNLLNDIRQGGAVTGGPLGMTPKDRSRFLAKLDDLVNAVRHAYPGRDWLYHVALHRRSGLEGADTRRSKGGHLGRVDTVPRSGLPSCTGFWPVKQSSLPVS